MYLSGIKAKLPASARVVVTVKPTRNDPFAVGVVQIDPATGYPIWNACGNVRGSGSPCNQHARRRYAELEAQGKTFKEISAIMMAEGSLKHYAGM